MKFIGVLSFCVFTGLAFHVAVPGFAENTAPAAQAYKYPCRDNPALKCLLGNFVTHVVTAPNYSAEKSLGFLAEIADTVIEADDPEAAKILLNSLPQNSERESDDEQKQTYALPILRMRLEFLRGNKERALKLLRDLRRETPQPTDYGALWPLLQNGDIDTAAGVAKEILSSKRIENYSYRRMHLCGWNKNIYPGVLGLLAEKLVAAGRMTEAEDIAKSINTAQTDSNCADESKPDGAARGFAALAIGYTKVDRPKKAAQLTEFICQNRHTLPDLNAMISRFANAHLEFLATQLLHACQPPLPKPISREEDAYGMRMAEDDYYAGLFSTAGDDTEALARIEKIQDVDIRLNTLLRIAYKSSDADDVVKLKKYLAATKPLLGRRARNFQNAQDMAKFAALSAAAGDKVAAEKATASALAIYETAERSDPAAALDVMDAATAIKNAIIWQGRDADLKNFEVRHADMRKTIDKLSVLQVLEKEARTARWNSYDDSFRRFSPLLLHKDEDLDAFSTSPTLEKLLINKNQRERFEALRRATFPQQPVSDMNALFPAAIAGKISATPEQMSGWWVEYFSTTWQPPSDDKESLSFDGAYLSLLRRALQAEKDNHS